MALPAVPIIWGLVIGGGLWGASKVAEEGGEAADRLNNLTQWAIVAGGLYVSYRALQSGGVIK
jgi:hypothetical protein